MLGMLAMFDTRWYGGSATRAVPQSAHTATPSRYSLRHSGHQTVAMLQCYARTFASSRGQHGAGTTPSGDLYLCDLDYQI